MQCYADVYNATEMVRTCPNIDPKNKKKSYGLVLYVDADTGSDGNVGSISQPFQTLAFAVLKAKTVPEGAR